MGESAGFPGYVGSQGLAYHQGSVRGEVGSQRTFCDDIGLAAAVEDTVGASPVSLLMEQPTESLQVFHRFLVHHLVLLQFLV